MKRTFIRPFSVAVAVAVVGAVAAGAALAAAHQGPFTGRAGSPGLRAGGLGQGDGMLGIGGPRFGFGGGPGFGGPGFGGPGLGNRGLGGGGGGLFGVDILTPAATYLGISPAQLAADLKGGKTLAGEATAKGKTAADLISAIAAAEKKILDADVSAGWLTSDQETSVLSGLTNQITNLVNSGPSVPPTKPAGLLGTAATYLNMPVSDLQTALKSGKTLADIVGTVSGKTVDGLVAAIEAPVKANLDLAVTNEKITSAQETAILTNLTTRLTNVINGKAGSGEQNAVLKNLTKFAARSTFGLRASSRR